VLQTGEPENHELTKMNVFGGSGMMEKEMGEVLAKYGIRNRWIPEGKVLSKNREGYSVVLTEANSRWRRGVLEYVKHVQGR